MAIISGTPQALARLLGSWRLPDLRNLGVVLRLLLLVNLLLLAAALVRNDGLARLVLDWAELAARVEPALLLFLLMAYALQDWLARIARVTPAWALAVLAALALLGSLSTAWMISSLAPAHWLATLVWTMVVLALCLGYLHLHDRALAPALAEARLLALTARIRPHFFFNCLNGVLGIMRDDPRRAEQALEEMADLFRALMRENRDLVSLGDEIALARQYLDLERLRLGERLRVNWDMSTCPPDALVPPLMLQPLLENAVRHGIELLTEPGEIQVGFERQGEGVLIRIVNPLPDAVAGGGRLGGNHMALDNIRERLMLFFDLEAQLTTFEADGCYCVTIRLPYRRGNQ